MKHDAQSPFNLGSDINIYTQIGLVTLIGLISKHGILMVEFANKLQEEQGLDKRRRIKEAAAVRLRPILMTTAAMVIGVVPLLIAAWRRRQEPLRHRRRHRRRHDHRHDVHAVHHACRLYLRGPRPAADGRPADAGCRSSRGGTEIPGQAELPEAAE